MSDRPICPPIMTSPLPRANDALTPAGKAKQLVAEWEQCKAETESDGNLTHAQLAQAANASEAAVKAVEDGSDGKRVAHWIEAAMQHAHAAEVRQKRVLILQAKQSRLLAAAAAAQQAGPCRRHHGAGSCAALLSTRAPRAATPAAPLPSRPLAYRLRLYACFGCACLPGSLAHPPALNTPPPPNRPPQPPTHGPRVPPFRTRSQLASM